MRFKALNLLGSLALATSLATGCMPLPASSGVNPDPGSAGDPGTATEPANPLNNGARYSGIYEADAMLNFTQPGVLPGLISPALAALSNLGTDPGKALIQFAQAAGAINLSDTLINLVASAIGSSLDAALPDDVKQVLTLISNVTRITQSTTLQTQLTVHTPANDGSVQVDIQVTGAAFDFVDLNLTSQHVVVKTSAANLAAARTTMTATLQPHNNAPIADADLIFNGGSLSIPIGDFMLQAMGPLIFKPEWGTADLKTTLQKIMAQPCQDLGNLVSDWMSNEGINFSADIGKTICTVGVTLAATEITDQVGTVTINGVKVSNGRAVLFDVSKTHPTADHQSDLLGNGSWTWSFGGADVPSQILDGTRTGTTF